MGPHKESPRQRSASSVSEAGFGEAELDELIVEVGNDKNGDNHDHPHGVVYRIFHSAMWSCLTYSFFSIMMTIANKVILTTYGFNYHMLLLLYQNSACVLLLRGARSCGLAQFDDLKRDRLIAWLPLNVLFILMLWSGFYSLNLLSVPMATIFKNCTNGLITAGDYFFYKRTVSRGIILSLAIMILGAVLAGRSDLEFDPSGYAWGVINCCITACYVLYMPRAIADSNLNAFGRVYYNNLLSLPLLLLIDLAVFRDIQNVAFSSTEDDQKLFSSPGFLFFFLLSGCLGFFLSLTSFQCVQHTNPTTYSFVGSFNKIPLAIIGIVVFNTQMNSESTIFISMSLLAGILYAYTKSQESK